MKYICNDQQYIWGRESHNAKLSRNIHKISTLKKNFFFKSHLQWLNKHPETWWQLQPAEGYLISLCFDCWHLLLPKLLFAPTRLGHGAWGWTRWPHVMKAYSEGRVLVLIQRFEDCSWSLQYTAPLLSSDSVHISTCLSLVVPDMLFSWRFSAEQIPSSAPVEQIAAREERVLTTD